MQTLITDVSDRAEFYNEQGQLESVINCPDSLLALSFLADFKNSSGLVHFSFENGRIVISKPSDDFVPISFEVQQYEQA